MQVRNTNRKAEEIELDMTSMIDIVFQLLIFFIMTFKIVAVEGDFNIKMPLAAPSSGTPDENLLPPIRVRLTAAPDGTLAGIRMGDRGLASFADLHNEVRAMIKDDTGPGSLAESFEVELDCDYSLHYIYVVDAITAVSGYVDANNNIVKLIEKIKFAPPRPAE